MNSGSERVPLMEVLRTAYYSLIAKVVDWMHGLSLPGSMKTFRKVAERRIFSMAIDLHPEGLLVIPAGFAVWFMLWALWHWWKEEKR